MQLNSSRISRHRARCGATVSLRGSSAAGHTIAVTMLGLACVSWPFYFLPEKSPQIYAIFMLASFAFLLLQRGPQVLMTMKQPEILLLWLFTAYTVAINMTFALSQQDPESLQYSIFYLMCSIGATVVHILLRSQPETARCIYYGLLLSLLIQMMFLLLDGFATPGRQALFFNNPNQLGFYGLLSTIFLCFLHGKLAEPTYVFVAGLIAALLLTLASLSKAAIVSAVVMITLHFITTPSVGRAARFLKPVLLVAVPIAVMLLVQAYGTELALLDRALDRISTIGVSNDDSVSARGYGRLLTYPHHMFLGAAEGAFSRWEPDREIHSMMATVVFCYGLPGTAIIFCLFASLIRRSPRDFFIYVIPVLLYSLTHNTLRQTMMWSLFITIAHVGSARHMLLMSRRQPQSACIVQPICRHG